MTQEETNSNPNEPSQNIPPTQSDPIESSVSDNNTPQAARQPRKRKKNLTVRVIQEKTNQPKIANWIAGIAAVISLAVGIVTLYLFSETKKANITTRDALKHQIHIDSLDSVASVRKDTIDSIVRVKDNFRADSTFKLQKRSLNAQIQSLQETQKEFDIENRPLLQVLNIQFDTLTVGKKLYLKYLYVNSGKQPIKLLTETVKLKIQNNKKESDYTLTNPLISPINIYLIGNAIYQKKWFSGIPIKEDFYKHVRNGDFSLHLIGSCVFKNNVTNRRSIYEYDYRIFYAGDEVSVLGVTDTTIVH